MSSVKIPIKVQKRSGFDKSHHNALTQYVGTITPILVDEVIPNSKVYLKYAMAGSLPPLAVDTYMKVYYDIRAFFVPFRLLWGGTESWFTNYPYNVVAVPSGVGDNRISQVQCIMPSLSIDSNADPSSILGPTTLSDYLGYKYDPTSFGVNDTTIDLSLLPFLAYHRVCDDWFRQPNISVSCFARPSSGISYNSSTYSYSLASAPFISPNLSNSVFILGSGEDITSSKFLLADGVSVFQLRQANYDYDYFTNALPQAQLGNPLTVSTSGGNFTIASLRAANSLQQFAEVNQLAGSNMVDVVKARYGGNLHDSMAQRCIYLGGARIDIASKTVETNTPTNFSSGSNPFRQSVGSTAARAIIQGSDLIIDDFVAQEPGYIFVVGTIIPKVTYGSGVRRYLRHYIGTGSLTDMANPMLQNVGNQPIYTYELDSSLGISAEQNQIFGYTDRYAEFMTMEDEVHGLMCINEPLSAFVAQRVWSPGDRPQIGSNFLSIPVTALNNITNFVSQISNYGFYGQFAFDYKVSQPLAQYSLPSLQNPAYEHGKTVMVHRGGFRF